MTQCNYCSLENLKKRARSEGVKIHVIVVTEESSKVHEPSKGTSIYFVPEGAQLDTWPGSDQFRAWLMKVPDKCAC